MGRLHVAGTAKRRMPVRMVILSAGATVALFFGGPIAPVAIAQSSNAPVLDSQRPGATPRVRNHPFPAPVGHRQPGRKDLPPGVARDEGSITASQRDFDGKLKICNC
jgi:hypothetical protein